MSACETLGTGPETAVIREYGEIGRSADKIVYSAGLEAPISVDQALSGDCVGAGGETSGYPDQAHEQSRPGDRTPALLRRWRGPDRRRAGSSR
jgi:hypothetical protein